MTISSDVAQARKLSLNEKPFQTFTLYNVHESWTEYDTREKKEIIEPDNQIN